MPHGFSTSSASSTEWKKTFGQGASHTQRQSVRAKRSTPLAEAIGEAMVGGQPKHRPKSHMGTALAYGLGHWEAMGRYLEDGRFEIDNNLVENAVRPVKLGA